MLLRHWNLYDSMYHSRFVAVRLGIWKGQGKRNLEMLFAKMGLPLEQAQQVYSNMSKKYKQILHQKLDQHAPTFNLEGFSFPSFYKKTSFSRSVSASDIVYATTALLESTQNLTQEITSENLLKNFWMAYDCLHPGNFDLLLKGFNEAVLVQKAIVRQAVTLIQKKQIVQLNGPFRYAIMNDSSDVKYFAHPITLSKLAQFLVDTIIESGKSKKEKPLLLAGLHQDKYLVVGVPGTHSGAPRKPTYFSSAFVVAAEKTGIALNYRTFDTAVVEVSRNDIIKFIEYLRSGLVKI